jgi:CRP/FNR family transcriptional regulator, dissimilatory nitrate respiration regulator
MDIQKIIAVIPLFESLPGSQHEALAGIALPRYFKKGDQIFSEGDEGTGFYTVVSGRIKIFKLSAEGKEQIFHFFRKGEVFGEVAVFTGKGYPANAEADERSVALFFPRHAFIGLIKRDPSLALNMLAVLSRRLHQFAELVEDLSLREVPSRLAAHLLYLSDIQDTDELFLEITKGQLAALLGTIPETLSRILNKMTRQNLIRGDRTTIRITDRKGLEAIAKGDRKL